MNTITTHHGVEGPRHDPYSFTEIALTLRGGEVSVTLHRGLGDYAELDVLIARKHQRTFMMARPEERLLADVTLQRWVGLTSTQIVRLARKAQEVPARLHKAHGGVEWVSGFPGETLCMCRCGMIIGTTFNEEAVR